MRISKLIKNKIFVISFFITIISYIVSLTVIQWILSQHPPSSFGLFSRPDSTKLIPSYNDIVIIWIASKQTVAGQSNFEWLTTITLTSFLLLILLAFISSINISLAGQLNIAKKTATCGAFTSIAGLSLATSAISACPACGTAATFTIVQAIMVGLTGSAIGASTLFVNISNAILISAIIINLILTYVLLRKIKKEEILNIKWKPIIKK